MSNLVLFIGGFRDGDLEIIPNLVYKIQFPVAHGSFVEGNRYTEIEEYHLRALVGESKRFNVYVKAGIDGDLAMQLLIQGYAEHQKNCSSTMGRRK